MLTVDTFNDIEIEDDVERLLILRKRMALSQYQFAKGMGISTSYLGQIERGEVPFSPQLRVRINDYLKREKEIHEKDIFSSF